MISRTKSQSHSHRQQVERHKNQSGRGVLRLIHLQYLISLKSPYHFSLIEGHMANKSHDIVKRTRVRRDTLTSEGVRRNFPEVRALSKTFSAPKSRFWPKHRPPFQVRTRSSFTLALSHSFAMDLLRLEKWPKLLSVTHAVAASIYLCRMSEPDI